MAKVLLVSTPWESNALTNPANDDDSHYPLGMAYLFSYLKSKGHTPDLLWLNNTRTGFIKQIVLRCCETAPDIVAFNMLTMNRTSTFQALEMVHMLFPRIQIVLGGIHATIMYNQIIREHPHVIIVRGEGESALDEIASGKPLDSIAGIVFMLKGRIYRTQERELLPLDILPFPEHNLFFKGDRTMAALITSRGCPNECSFCCLNPTSRRKVRYRSVDNVLAEIQYLVKTFPQLKTIWIHDDSFFLNNNRVIRICDEIIQRGIKMQFICSGRARPISAAMIPLLEKAGFVQVLIGLESGDAGVLERCKKEITLDDARKAVELFRDTAIELTFFIIVGLPGETEQTIKNTAAFIQEMQRWKYIYFHDVGILAVYPGTHVYQRMRDAGCITDEYWLSNQPTPLYTVDHDEYQLHQLKELLLNRISADRIITAEGIRNQWRLIPQILPYAIKRKLARYLQ